jgi:hypothetical protein
LLHRRRGQISYLRAGKFFTERPSGPERPIRGAATEQFWEVFYWRTFQISKHRKNTGARKILGMWKNTGAAQCLTATN